MKYSKYLFKPVGAVFTTITLKFQISLICKLGSHNYEDMKQFSACVEDAMFRLSAHRDNIHINYKMEEVQITAVDELYVEQNSNGAINRQIARVRLFFLGFLTGRYQLI